MVVQVQVLVPGERLAEAPGAGKDGGRSMTRSALAVIATLLVASGFGWCATEKPEARNTTRRLVAFLNREGSTTDYTWRNECILQQLL